MKIIYPALFHEEENAYWVEFPDLEGCNSFGETKEEVFANAQEAMEGYILTVLEDAKRLPTPSDIRDIKCDENSFVSYVTSDLLVYPACFYPDEDGCYTVVVPDLPGCVTEGKDFAEALHMAVDAAGGWVRTALEDGEEIPKASELGEVKADEYENGFVNLIVLDAVK